jgi:phospholipid/cholesterol/gamma-HCH transport system substrate-binding protein
MKIKREYTIALLVLFSSGLLIFGINYLKGLDLFQQRNVFHVVYRDVSGINSSSPVYYRGFKVGQVIGTTLIPSTGNIAVSFQLNEDKLLLPRDSKVQLYSADLFTRALQLLPGTATELALAGDTLMGDSQLSLTDAVGEQIDPLKRKAEGMLANVDTLLSALQRLLNDTTIGDIDASFSSIRGTLEALNRTADRVDHLIAVETTTIQAVLANVRTISANMTSYHDELSSILTNMDSVTSVLAGQQVRQAIADLSTSSAKLKELMTSLEAGEGTLGALMTNDTLYRNLDSASRELDLLMEDLRMNPNRYVHLSLFGKKDKLPKLSDSDVDRIKKALQEDNRMPRP